MDKKLVASELKVIAGLVEEAVKVYSEGATQWKGTPSSSSEVIKAIQEALKDGYNEFDADKVISFIKKNSSYKYILGREYSPVLYVLDVPVEKIPSLARQAKSIKANEIGFYLGSDYHDIKEKEAYIDQKDINLRLWWD